MKPRKITCARYCKLKNKCLDALKYSERKFGPSVFNDEFSEDFYEEAERRYNYSCELLKRKIISSGIELPDKYDKPDKQYLCYESNVSIGEHFNELLAIYKSRKSILAEERRINNYGHIIENQLKTKHNLISKNVQFIIDRLDDLGFSWEQDTIADDWIILIEPISRKKIKIQVDNSGCMRNCIHFSKIKDALVAVSKKFNKPFDNISLNEGTLTDCGWHAYLPLHNRIEALDIAISIYGKTRTVKALQVTLNSPWLAGYSRSIQKDIDYASRGRFARSRSKEWDALIYIKIS